MIYIMRHGQSLAELDGRIHCKQQESDLTTIGYNQAHQAGLWLQDKAVQQIIISPQAHAQKTAQIIGKVIGIEPTIDPALCEADCGNLSGQADETSWAQWRSLRQRWHQGEADARFPEGESLRDAFTRFAEVLHALPADQNPVIITHGEISRSVVPLLCVNAAALQRINILSHTGFTTLERYGTSRYICKAWDLNAHLS